LSRKKAASEEKAMRYVESMNRMQMVLYPEKLDDLVEEESGEGDR
jgi:hypothetical protein